MVEKDIKIAYPKGTLINLTGFTSSTLERESALAFAFDDDTIDNYDP